MTFAILPNVLPVHRAPETFGLQPNKATKLPFHFQSHPNEDADGGWWLTWLAEKWPHKKIEKKIEKKTEKKFQQKIHTNFGNQNRKFRLFFKPFAKLFFNSFQICRLRR